MDELARDVADATRWFRKERMEEPLDDYVASFDLARDATESLLADTLNLVQVK